MPLYDAVTRQDYIRAKRSADEQEKITNDSYRAYLEVAKALSKFIEDNDDEIPPKQTPEYKQYRILIRKKQEAYKAWQTEAYKHGAMFVDMTPRAEIDPMAERMF